MEELTGRVAVVTGAASEIGEGVARALAAAGMRVALVARGGARLAAVAAEIAAAGGSARALPADVTDEAAVRTVFAAVDAELGTPFLLVNGAGITHADPLETLTLALWNRVIATNLTAAFLCSREAFGRMRRAGGGRIVSIGSLAARAPRWDAAAANAAASGLEALMRTIAIEGRAHLVTASCIHPGATHGVPPPDHPDGWADALAPADIGRLVVYAASLPRDCTLLDATLLPVRLPFLARG